MFEQVLIFANNYEKEEECEVSKVEKTEPVKDYQELASDEKEDLEPLYSPDTTGTEETLKIERIKLAVLKDIKVSETGTIKMSFNSLKYLSHQDLEDLIQIKVVPGDDDEADESRLAFTWSLV